MNNKDKEKTLKADKEKQYIIFRETISIFFYNNKHSYFITSSITTEVSSQ